MKRFFASAVLGFVSCALSASVFAADFSGSGDWKSNQGGSGTYNISLNVSDQGLDKVITKQVTFGDQAMTVQFTVHHVDDTFFKIVMGGNTVGGGYCWAVEDSTTEKICHFGLKSGGIHVEESLHVTPDSVSSMGSKWDAANHLKIVWKDHLSLVNSDDAN